MALQEHVKTNNLEPEIAGSVELDLTATKRSALANGRDISNLRLHLLALDRPHDAKSSPTHNLKAPAQATPPDLTTRCEWQKQRDSFEIIEKDGAIWIIGGSSSGVMYGVNEALSCRTGIIWASQQENSAVFGPLRDLPNRPQIPRIAYRGMYGGNPDWFGRQRLNFRMMGAKYNLSRTNTEQTASFKNAFSRAINPTLSEHAMDAYLPVEVLKANPEWMGMRNGRRCLSDTVDVPECPHLRAPLPIQPCYSNAEARDFIASRMAAFRDSIPEISFFGVWPHDGVNNWCQCNACHAISPFEHMHTLALDLQKKLKNPAALELIAYSNMLNLPRAALQKSNNVYAFFCAYLRSFQHRIFDSDGPQRIMTGVNYPEPDRINPLDEREYGKIFENWLPFWREAGIVPAVFEYGGDFPDETFRMDHQRYLHVPAPQLREDEACWYAEHGVNLAILCGAHKEWPDAFPDLAWAHSLWGNEPMASLRRRFYAAIGGTHGSQLADAVDNLSSSLKNSHAVPQQALRDLEDVLRLLPENIQTLRYRDWMGYIRLGRNAWNLLRSGNSTAAADAEIEIRKYIETRSNNIPIAEFLIARSRHYEKRSREKASGQSGREYVL